MAKRDYKDYRRLLDMWQQQQPSESDRVAEVLGKRRSQGVSSKGLITSNVCPESSSSFAPVTLGQPAAPPLISQHFEPLKE